MRVRLALDGARITRASSLVAAAAVRRPRARLPLGPSGGCGALPGMVRVQRRQSGAPQVRGCSFQAPRMPFPSARLSRGPPFPLCLCERALDPSARSPSRRLARPTCWEACSVHSPLARLLLARGLSPSGQGRVAGSSRRCCSKVPSAGARGGGRRGSFRAVRVRPCRADATGWTLACPGGSPADGTVAQGAVRSVRSGQAGFLSRRPDQGGSTQRATGRCAAPSVVPRRPLPSDCVDLMRVAAPSVRVGGAGQSVRLKARWRGGS